MVPKILLAVNDNGMAVKAFDPGTKIPPETIAEIITRQARNLGLDVTVAVVPVSAATAQEITLFLGECWTEKHGKPGAPPLTPTTLFPSDAYSR